MNSKSLQNLRKRGTPGNKGGGRPPDWLKEKCQNLVKDKKLYEWLADVAGGEKVEDKIFFKGNKPIRKKVAAGTYDRIRAIELLSDRGWGKPAQAVQVSGDSENPVVVEKTKSDMENFLGKLLLKNV